MKLARRIDRALALIVIITLFLLFGCLLKIYSNLTFAEGEDTTFDSVGAKYVSFYDNSDKLTIKTESKTVKEAIDRAGIIINAGDKVEPGLDAEINADNFFINIYRARPVIIKDGTVEKYLMTASYDVKTIAGEAGLLIYDGDEIEMLPNTDFLEVGVASMYKVVRNGGRTVTEDVEIPFAEETVKDASLETGKSEVRQLGEVGLKKVTYNVYYIDNKEVSREVIAEEVVREPVARVVAVGVRRSLPPASETCAEWVRAAGVAESDVAAAIDLIYHESGCRVDARNASSGAYGIPQALPGNKMAAAGADWETNPITQIRWMSGYVSRYGGWTGALNFWYEHGWY
ncbi:G5 domain-containing protein [Candidatus Saccharibacteria bacterium]|nr:G5 domain-containing protein [Candidatus Saccharibacteria bacterium]